MPKMNLRDLDVAGRRVLVRVDFNVPIRDRQVGDDLRIQASLPTIQYLVERGAAITLISHLGRPKNGPDPQKSLAPVAACLSERLGLPVDFASDCIGSEAAEKVANLKGGGLLLLENLRFHPEETANDPDFSRQLAAHGDLYINDAFGSAHRAHASTEGVTHFIHPCAAGFLMEKELAYLGGAMEDPRRPFVAVLGGAKISGKIDVLESLLPKVDTLLVGGAMMFTFLRAKGHEVGRSLVEEDRLEMARALLAKIDRSSVDLILPIDCRVADSTDGSDPGTIVSVEAITSGKFGVDIGPQSVEQFRSILTGAGTVIWNGPMGIFEVTAYAEGTISIGRALADATDAGATTIVGGGDSAAAIRAAKLTDRISHVSTGGGAALEFLEGKELPGVAALTEQGR